MNGKDPNRSLEKLRRSRKVLESRVQERTAELVRVNEALQAIIAEHRRAERELSLLLSIIEAICDCEDFNSAIKVTLQKVCETTGWQYAEVWIPCADGTALDCSPGGKLARAFDRNDPGWGSLQILDLSLSTLYRKLERLEISC